MGMPITNPLESLAFVSESCEASAVREITQEIAGLPCRSRTWPSGPNDLNPSRIFWISAKKKAAGLIPVLRSQRCL